MSQERVLAVQLETLLREASGFKARLATVSAENTRLSRQLKEARQGSDADSTTLRKLKADLKASRAEAKGLREAADAEAKRRSHEKVKVDGQIRELKAALKDAARERESQARWKQTSEQHGGRRDEKLRGVGKLAREQGHELTQTRAALDTRTKELADEESRRRRAEGKQQQLAAKVAQLEEKVGSMTKAMSLAKIQLQKQKVELDARHRVVQDLHAADPGQNGAYTNLIRDAQKAIRQFNAGMPTPTRTPPGSAPGSRRGSDAGTPPTSARRRRPKGSPAARPASAAASPAAASPAASGAGQARSPTSAAAMSLSADLSALLSGLASPSAATSAPAAAPAQPLVAPTKAEREALFKRMDYNGNGALSLAEIDKAVLELYPGFDNKPALMRAYKAADVSADGFVRCSVPSQSPPLRNATRPI